MGCAPGTFVTNTGCQRCPNRTFTDKFNATKCLQCDRCVGRHNETTKVCTSSSNTECSCQSGYYFDGSIVFCSKCLQCDRCVGRHNEMMKACSSSSHTECSCQSGYYFDGFGLFCLKCLQCKREQGVDRNCTDTNNTACGLCVKVRGKFLV